MISHFLSVSFAEDSLADQPRVKAAQGLVLKESKCLCPGAAEDYDEKKNYL